MRVNWWSPLPRAGVLPDAATRYTCAALACLAGRFELRLFTFQESWDPEVERLAPVLRCDREAMPWQTVNGAEVSLYVLTDEADVHRDAWAVGRLHRGIVVLADENLGRLVADLPPAGLEELAPWMLSVGGSGAMKDLEALRSGGRVPDAYDFGELAARRALGVLLHGEARAARMARAAPCPVAFAPQPDASRDGGAAYAAAVADLVARALRYRPAAMLDEVAQGVTSGLRMWGPPTDGYLPEEIRPHVEAISAGSAGLIARLAERVAGTSAAMPARRTGTEAPPDPSEGA